MVTAPQKQIYRQNFLDAPDNNRHVYCEPHRWIDVRLIVGIGF